MSLLQTSLTELEKHSKNNGEYVSFDIFDTLLERRLSSPLDVFRKTSIGYFNDPELYVNLRTTAERNSRNDVGETTIELIKQELYKSLEISIVDELIKKELAIEKLVLKPRDIGKNLYQKAIELEKKIIIISDMYLSETFLQEILIENGYTGYEKLLVSCEYNEAKWNGKLYQSALKECNINNPKTVIHFGDNFVADVEKAKQEGLNAFHLPFSSRERDEWEIVNDLTKLIEPYCKFTSSLIREGFYNRFKKTTEVNKWKQVGYALVGPTLLNFLPWINNECKKEGIEKILFMARDAEIMYKGYQMLFPKSEISSSYTFGSRRATYLPTISKQIDLILKYILPSTKKINTNYFLDIIPNSASEILSIIKTAIKEEWTVEQLNNELKKIPKAFEEFLGKEKEIARAYYQKESASKKTAIVDIGWSGTIHRSIELYLQNPVHGFYLGTINPFYCKKNTLVKGFLIGGSTPSNTSSTIIKGLEVLEFLFSGTHASTKKFKPGNSKIEPVFCSLSGFEQDRIRHTKEIHRGALDFLTDIKDVFGDQLMTSKKGIWSPIYQDFIHTPPQSLANLFTEILHCATAGGQDYRPIVSTTKTFKKGQKLSFWKEGYRSTLTKKNSSKKIMLDAYNWQKKISNKIFKKFK